MNIDQIRSALHVAAVFAIYLAGMMLIPAAVDLYYGNDDWQVFAFSALLVGGGAATIAVATRGAPPPVSPRFGFLMVNTLWLTMAAAGAVPFIFSAIDLSLTDAMFESVSGVTTTGSSIMVNLEQAPPGIVLWRSLLSFMGGLGVIALGLFLLPFLNIGGVSYFKIESNDIQDRPFERLQTYMVSLFGIYAVLVFTCAAALSAAGMEGFHAINHAMTTMATAGLSSHSDSFLRYDANPAVLWIVTVFMFIGGLPFSIMMLLIVRGRTEALLDPQIRVYAGYTIVFVLATAV
ncbi:TrkH family potassium uptake protein, partial [Salmonella enterica subsp. enterica serovar Virchow]|nr:TrkH family potassium uptake protein [Salmonella enterica subsp. enterica serovar Virchow]